MLRTGRFLTLLDVYNALSATPLGAKMKHEAFTAAVRELDATGLAPAQQSAISALVNSLAIPQNSEGRSAEDGEQANPKRVGRKIRPGSAVVGV